MIHQYRTEPNLALQAVSMPQMAPYSFFKLTFREAIGTVNSIIEFLPPPFRINNRDFFLDEVDY